MLYTLVCRTTDFYWQNSVVLPAKLCSSANKSTEHYKTGKIPSPKRVGDAE